MRKGRRAGALMAALLLSGGAVASGAVVQRHGLRITVLSQVQPYKLPRTGTAPIAVFVGGHLSTPSGAIPPQLNRLTVDVNRHGLLQSRGLPVCRTGALRSISTEQALAACAPSLIGSGQFWAHILLPGQRPYPTRGRILIFNGRRHGGPALLVHIFTANPFNASFTIVFGIRRIDRGRYGTRLDATFTKALGEWGYVDRIKLTLKRKYRRRGRELSYFNAGCPAPAGADRTVFPLARVSFSFAELPSLGTTVDKACAVRE